MMENETIDQSIQLLKGMQNPKVDYADLVGAEPYSRGYKYVYPEPEDYAIEDAIAALKEVQQYREIGTVEECREARKKQNPKEPNGRVEVDPVIADNGAYVDAEIYVNLFCPICGACVGGDEWRDKFCCKCGQAISQGVSDD